MSKCSTPWCCWRPVRGNPRTSAEVTTASTNLQALTDALLYLVHYPFECAEQRSSRIVAIAALKDVLAAFHAKELPAPSALAASVATDLERLSQMQNGDGGFAFWDRGYPSVPYLTVFVSSALGLAQKKGFAVPADIDLSSCQRPHPQSGQHPLRISHPPVAHPAVVMPKRQAPANGNPRQHSCEDITLA